MQQRLEQVSGVSRVVMKDSKDGRLAFEVESLQGRQIRAELARTVVNAGWNLSELRAVGLSLEDIFLELTSTEKKKAAPEGAAAETPAPENKEASNEKRTPDLLQGIQELILFRPSGTP